MLKIGLFLPTAPAHRGGAFVFENEIFQHVLRFPAGASVQFIFFGWGPRPEVLPAHLGYENLNRTPSERIKTRLQFLWWRLSEEGRRRTANWMRDYVTSRIASAKIDYLWYPGHTVAFTNWPYIFTVWDLQHRNSPYYPEVSRDGEFEHREAHFSSVIPKASFIIVGTDAGKEEVIRYYHVPERRIWKIPHPAPTVSAPPENYKPPIYPKRPFLFYPAQFWPHKNHVTLLHALVVLEKKHGLVYDLVFTGSEKGNGMWVKQVAASLGLLSRVHMAGFVEREALHFYYTHARAMVYASLCGPENLPPLEAAQLNCPVVAANVPGAEEQLGDFAQLVDGLSAEAWADAIAKLETDAEFREKSIAAGLKRSKSFSGADFVKRFVSLAQETLPLRRTWGW